MRRRSGNEGTGARGGRPHAAENYAAGAGSVAWIVEKVRIQVVERIRIVVVEVVAFGNQQPPWIRQFGMRRVACIRVADRMPAPGGRAPKSGQAVEDVGLPQAPVEVVVGCGVVSGRSSGSGPAGRTHDVLGHEITEHRFCMDHFGLSAQGSREVPGPPGATRARGTIFHSEPSAVTGSSRAPETDSLGEVPHDRPRILRGRHVDHCRQRLEFRLPA